MEVRMIRPIRRRQPSELASVRLWHSTIGCNICCKFTKTQSNGCPASVEFRENELSDCRWLHKEVHKVQTDNYRISWVKFGREDSN